MNTRERIDLLVRAHPRLFSRAELLLLLDTELGHPDALDLWFHRRGIRVRARAPLLIYHLCAGNLAISAINSLVHGLLLGARNLVKLPGDRADASTRRDIMSFIQGLPPPLRKLVQTERELNTAHLQQADVVIAFGSDATMKNIRKHLRWNQRFIAHGHAVSLLWLPEGLTPRQARACAMDVLTYDQLGCLSPQAIYAPPPSDFPKLGDLLAKALESHWQKLKARPARPLSVAARIAEARDVAHALGHRMWLPRTGHLGWTVIHDLDANFAPSPLHGVIYLREASERQLTSRLRPVSGRISTVGLVGKLSSRSEAAFLNLGVSRFCPAGRMQFPPLTWHHDGRPALGEWVTFIDAE